ncbi:retrotransposon protein [Tanacetum coccineum]
MMGNRKLFSSFKAYNGANVMFGSNLRGNIISKGRGIRKKGLYVMKLGNKPEDKICLATIDENSTLWHRRLGHANMRLIQSLASKELVRNLPKLKFDQHFCDACKIRKQAHASHKAKNIVSTTRCLELLHMDLFGPSAVRSYRGNRYTLVIVDDYSSFVMPMVLHITSQLHALHNQMAWEKEKIRTLQEMSRTMLKELSLPQKFWCDAENQKILYVTFDETPPPSKTSPLVDDDPDEEEAIREIEKKNLENFIEDETLEINEIVIIKESRNHPLENVIGNLNQRTLTSQAQNQSNFYCFISTIEPKNVNEALGDESWIVDEIKIDWRKSYTYKDKVLNYALWEVIENGNSFKPVARTTTNADGTSTSMIPGPVTTEEKAQKKNDVKARSMLLMALPNEHQLTFNQYKDAKTLFDAIQTRFGGNDATKKSQKTLLKQMYENFNAPSTESLDSISNRLQKIVSQLAILGENISQEDLNLKFLRSLPSEWNTHDVVWRNKPDLDTISFDDLYNNLKIIEQEVKKTVTTSSSSGSQNMAFVSTPGSTNLVYTANVQVSTASTPVSTASTQVCTTNLSDDTVYAFLASQPNGSQLVYEDLEQIHDDDLEEMDLKWQLALLSMRTRRFF